MADSTVDITGPFDRPQKLLKVIDNGDGTYSISAALINNSVIFDTIAVTYTDATKTVISKVEWKLGSTVVKTLTPTYAAIADTWVKS